MFQLSQKINALEQSQMEVCDFDGLFGARLEELHNAAAKTAHPDLKQSVKIATWYCVYNHKACFGLQRLVWVVKRYSKY